MIDKKPDNYNSKQAHMGASTFEAKEVVKASSKILHEMVPGEDLTAEITRRCIQSTGDPTIAHVLHFNQDPEIGVAPIKRGYDIIVDVNMVKAGLRKESISAIDFSKNEGNNTRVASGLERIGSRVEGSFMGIGNSPSAAITICEMVENSGIKPSFIVATPVGFVNAAESKERINKLGISSITTLGPRGGSTICAAIINCLIDYANRSH